jgi:hypothetical protein
MSHWRQLDVAEREVWANATAPRVVVDRASRAIRVSGPCAVCGHDFDVVLTADELVAEAVSRGVTLPNGMSAELDWTGTLTFLATCYCESDHTGRPNVISHGCGASGWLVDEPEV